ncbi:MAG: ArsR family transcriptional regulator [Desulfobacteraceae bacterium]|nr:MAG: ArsR family transcriptional regulator [Desulfobacteraceae bacterium]
MSALTFFCAHPNNTGKATAAKLISVQEARAQVLSGQALLVCAYDSDELFNKMRLEGAVALGEFKKKFANGDKNRTIIFYCA